MIHADTRLRSGCATARSPAASRSIALAVPRGATSIAADIITFAVAASSVFLVHLVGDLPVADMLLVLLAPMLITLCQRRLRRRRVGTLFALLGLWLFGQVLSDVYRRTGMFDWMRADARILFWGVDLACMAILVGRNARRHALFLAGYAVGALLVVRLQPNEFTDSWKFGYASGVTSAVLLACCFFSWRGRHVMVVLLLLSLAAVDMVFNFRSQILFLFITIALVTPVLPERAGRLHILPATGTLSRVLLLVLLVLGAARVAVSAVLFFAARGTLGPEAMEKNETQAKSKGGLLLGGRSEILVSSRAVIDSPFVGHGAWAKGMKYVEMYQDLRAQYGLPQEDAGAGEEDLIPTHSHLMDAWVDAGLSGALFWFFVFCLILKALVRASATRPLLAPAYVYGFVSFLWAMLFSPPGGITILPESFLLIVGCDLLEDACCKAQVFSRARPARLVWRRPAKHAREMLRP